MIFIFEPVPIFQNIIIGVSTGAIIAVLYEVLSSDGPRRDSRGRFKSSNSLSGWLALILLGLLFLSVSGFGNIVIPSGLIEIDAQVSLSSIAILVGVLGILAGIITIIQDRGH